MDVRERQTERDKHKLRNMLTKKKKKKHSQIIKKNRTERQSQPVLYRNENRKTNTTQAICRETKIERQTYK
jgi:hypothetical protein